VVRFTAQGGGESYLLCVSRFASVRTNLGLERQSSPHGLPMVVVGRAIGRA
jgi:hypothetical protein